MKFWKVILAALVIFCAGVVTGGLTVDSRYKANARPASASPVRPSAPWSAERTEFQQRELLRRMEKQLSLTPAQSEQIGQLVRESYKRTKGLWGQISPQMNDEFRSLRENICAELRPEQKKKFQEVFKPRPPWSHDGGRSAEERRKREEQRDRQNSSSPSPDQPAAQQPSRPNNP